MTDKKETTNVAEPQNKKLPSKKSLPKDEENSIQASEISEPPKAYPNSFAEFIILFLVGSLTAGNGYIFTCVFAFEPILQSRYNYNAFTVSTLNSITNLPKLFTSF